MTNGDPRALTLIYVYFSGKMSSPSINIYFDYGGHYTKTEDSFEWHPQGGSYGISFKAKCMGEITYSDLVARICKKVGVDESKTRLRLSFVPLVVLPHIRTSVCDDDDVYLYLTSMDSEQRRSVLHVEVLKELERVDGRSSHGENYGEIHSSGRANFEASHGVVSKYGGKRARIEHRDIGDSDDSMENAIIGVGESESHESRHESEEEQNPKVGNNVDNNVDTNGDDNADNNTDDNEENNADNNADDNEDNDVDNSGDHVMEESTVQLQLEGPIGESGNCVEPWADGLNFVVGQEFESKQALKQLVERAMHENCFTTTLLNSDTNRYVMRCRASAKGCKWSLRATRVKNSAAFTVKNIITSIHALGQVLVQAAERMEHED